MGRMAEECGFGSGREMRVFSGPLDPNSYTFDCRDSFSAPLGT
jgi:hypothetical protein